MKEHSTKNQMLVYSPVSDLVGYPEAPTPETYHLYRLGLTATLGDYDEYGVLCLNGKPWIDLEIVSDLPDYT